MFSEFYSAVCARLFHMDRWVMCDDTHVCVCVWMCGWINLLFCCQKAYLINIHLKKQQNLIFFSLLTRRIKNYYWYLLSDFEIIFHRQLSLSLSSSKLIFEMFNNHSIGSVKGGRLKAIFEKLKIYMLTTCKSYIR